MREIKFRALELDSPSGVNWVYGYYRAEKGWVMCDNIPDYNQPVTRYFITDEYGHEFDVAENTVGQFMRRSTDGKIEFFEGDEIYYGEEGDAGYLFIEESTGECLIHFYDGDCNECLDDFIDEIELIGNIHEDKL